MRSYMRFALYFALFTAIALTTTSSSQSRALDLSLLPPVAQSAEPVDHFPSRTIAFVWRNWNLAPTDKLAQTIDARPEDVEAIARELGLKPYVEPTWEPARIYITLTRRNWSLLPYEQLLTLLDLTPEAFAEKLREDDFLSVKLGAKPLCEPLIYEPPTEEQLAAARKIAAEVRETLGDELDAPEVPRFEFLKEFEGDGADEPTSASTTSGKSQFELCYLHSYFAVFGDPLLQDSAKLYPDGLLSKLAARGVNGVWLHAVLRDLTPGTADFPEFGARSDERRANLRNLVERAKKFGIDVYLYMNEPRAMPAAFFEKHEHARGVAEGAYCAMCEKAPEVRRWLSDSLAFLFKDVPGLGGVFTITGSENLTSCVSHGNFAQCPRCSKFTDADLIVDLNAAIEEGVHRSAPDAKVIVWDWGWRGHGMATDIIERLPKNVWLQSVSEWALPLNRGGVPVSVGEYSISAVGPGERAKTHWATAKQSGLKTIAKCQFNTTWEIASIPSIPALDLVARHAYNLSRSGVDGVMAGWSLGGFPSVNLETVNAFAVDPNATEEFVLNELATKYFGEQGASLARKGWTQVSNAFTEFPYGGSVLYCAPNQIGPANLLRLQPTGWRATMVGIPYDDLNAWTAPYPPEIFAQQMEKCGKGFLEGARTLNEAAKFAPKGREEDAKKQSRYAQAAGAVYLSCANQARFVVMRDERIALKQELEAAHDEAKSARVAELTDAMIKIAQDEIELAKTLRRTTLEDSCIGFESTCQYWFVPNDLVEKIVSCLDIIERLKRE